MQATLNESDTTLCKRKNVANFMTVTQKVHAGGMNEVLEEGMACAGTYILRIIFCAYMDDSS